MAKTAAKAPVKKPADPRTVMIEAALVLAQQLGWAHVTMNDIAQESGATLADLYERFADKGDIITAYERDVTRRVLEAASNDPAADPRDTLFDLLMDRFEILNEQRPALLSVLAAYRYDPKEYLIGLPLLGRSMAWMLEAAGVETTGWRGAARIAGLTAVYLAALKAWVEDESADLPKTMAALDKNLARAEQWAGRFSL